MNITNKTVLITGGGSGIGFYIAKLLGEKGNRVIITGRTEEKLKLAASQLANVDYLVADVTKEADANRLAEELKNKYNGLDILINNAANASLYGLTSDLAFDKAYDEINTNYLSVIRLNEKLLPLLGKQPEAAIVNVTSIVAFAPGIRLAGYAASKAALHSYTQSLRRVLAQSTNVKVFELMPPLVNTEFSKEIGGEQGMPPEAVAQALLEGFASNTYEIHVGQTADFYEAFFASSGGAFEMINNR